MKKHSSFLKFSFSHTNTKEFSAIKKFLKKKTEKKQRQKQKLPETFFFLIVKLGQVQKARQRFYVLSRRKTEVVVVG